MDLYQPLIGFDDFKNLNMVGKVLLKSSTFRAVPSELQNERYLMNGLVACMMIANSETTGHQASSPTGIVSISVV